MGIKQGMVSYFLPSGIHVPATVVHVQHNEVLRQIARDPSDPADERSAGKRNELTNLHARARKAYLALQVYAGQYGPHEKAALRSKSTTQLKGHVREFRVTPDALLAPGTELSALHFVPGQQVDVVGTTKGKGFQGAMKRHGFKGLRASHGVSISHRSHGSTGQHQDPGRVFPGKKMAGRMGGKQSTVHNVTLLRVDVPKQLLFLKGQLPGPNGSLVMLTDAKRSLIGKARNAVVKGKTRDGALAQGNEKGAAYLPPGIEDLPFPAATREMEKYAPAVVEVSAL